MTTTPSTFFNSGTVIGRLYGRLASDECHFDVVHDHTLMPAISVRFRGTDRVITIPFGTRMLVQLFEQPDVLWVAHATTLEGTSTICYAPIAKLESLDGRVEFPPMMDVRPELVAEALADATQQRQPTPQP